MRVKHTVVIKVITSKGLSTVSLYDHVSCGRETGVGAGGGGGWAGGGNEAVSNAEFDWRLVSFWT